MFPMIRVHRDGDGAWPDLADREVDQVYSFQVARLPGGMESGATAIAIRIELSDGRVAIAHTSMKAWRAATLALEGFES